MAEQNFEPIEDSDLAAVSGGADDQGDQSNWYHKKCPECGSTNIKVTQRALGIPYKQECSDCGYEWYVIGPDQDIPIPF